MRNAQTNPEIRAPEASLTRERSHATRILQAQDDERRKIGRELHDSVGQSLVAIKMGIARCIQDRAIEEGSALDDVLSLLDSTIAEVRTISHLLHPPNLDLMGLRAALGWYVQGFQQRTCIETELHAPDELPFLSPFASTVLFRVAQECLTNIHKHAQASRVSLRFVIGNGELQLEVNDNGKGFADLDSCRQGVGILGMQERLSELGGTLRIESGRDAGSSVFATVPLIADPPTFPKAARQDEQIRVLIVDDHPAIRYGVRMILTAQPGIAVCGEASREAEAVELASKLLPDVMILDLQLDDASGWSVVRKLRDAQSSTRILIFSHYDELYVRTSADRAGCHGFVSKASDANALVDAVRTVQNGGKYFKVKTVGKSA